MFGKLIFVLCDIITGYLIYSLCKSQNIRENIAVICSCLWLLNPVPSTVSSRGNAESIMAVLVLFALKLTQENKIILAAIVYAVSVHVKIYPMVYALQIYLYLGLNTKGESSSKSLTGFIKDLWPNRRRLIFIITAGATLIGLTALCYHW